MDENLEYLSMFNGFLHNMTRIDVKEITCLCGSWPIAAGKEQALLLGLVAALLSSAGAASLW